MPKSVSESGSAGLIKLKLLCQSCPDVHMGQGRCEIKVTVEVKKTVKKLFCQVMKAMLPVWLLVM